MRNILLSLFVLLGAVSASAQEIRSREAGFEDFRELLTATGYESFCFDTSDFLTADCADYTLAFRIEEYTDGVGETVFKSNLGRMKNVVFDKDGKRYEFNIDKINVGIHPAESDSLVYVSCITTMGRMTQRLAKHPLRIPGGRDLVQPRYGSRPFALGSFEAGRFIPLVMYGSYWFDEPNDAIRFCGEREIAPDMSSEIVGSIPHFYVMGIELRPAQ